MTPLKVRLLSIGLILTHFAARIPYTAFGMSLSQLTRGQENWIKIYTPVVQMLKLQIKMNVKGRCILIRVRRKNRHTRSYIA